MMPATFASPSTVGPAASMICSIVAASAMSPATITIRSSEASARSASSRSAEMSAPITRAPSRCKRTAVARPMPDPAPVTMIVCPVNPDACSMAAPSHATAAAGSSLSSRRYADQDGTGRACGYGSAARQFTQGTAPETIGCCELV